MHFFDGNTHLSGSLKFYNFKLVWKESLINNVNDAGVIFVNPDCSVVLAVDFHAD